MSGEMAEKDNHEGQSGESFETSASSYKQSLNLQEAGDMMNTRISQIMRLVYAEEEKAEPDAEFLEALTISLHRVSSDRHDMHGVKPAVVLRMIDKYRRMLKQDAIDHE